MNKETKSAIIVGAICAILALGATWMAYSTKDEIAAKEAEIATVTQEIDGYKAKVEAGKGLTAQLESIEQNLSNYIKILPPPDILTEEELIRLVHEKSDVARFAVSSILIKEQKQPPAKGREAPAFEEITIDVAGVGTFEQMLKFLNELESQQSFFRINEFTCRPPTEPIVDEDGREHWPLTATVNISTFRYRPKQAKK